tara:strand:+ start:1495 stop:1740 length:246 start_codon:yes stop_codon:yes gene_type:complete
MKIQYVNPRDEFGTKKTDKEIIEEMELILNVYRRNNILINDKLYNNEHNIIPVKDECIALLKQHIEKLKQEVKDLKLKKWW